MTSENTLKIFIATDNHLGYAEKDPVRGNDSFETFEEILQLAKESEADFLLLGGDLYHDNKPSRSCIYRSMTLLRNYTMGNGPIKFRILSDQSLNFPNYGIVNFEDPNINVELPVFTIRGNHDDPTRDGYLKALTSLDLLSVANLINYFGRCDQVDNIEILPVLMMKGTTRVAIYGLGNMRDERLNRMFAQKKVKFRRPAEHQADWFNIFVIHQNRDNRGRGNKNCIHESFIPEFIDFVLWGHEHDCRVELEESMKGNFFISQPGSSVATSLIEGESKDKKVGLLEVRGQDFRWKIKPLKTVRPFLFEELRLADYPELEPNDPDITTAITKRLSTRVKRILEDHAEQVMDHRPHNEEQLKKKVLVRLKVEYTGFPIINNQRFGSQFVGKVANPDNILLFHRKRATSMATGMIGRKDNEQRPKGENENEKEDQAGEGGFCVEEIVAESLDHPERKLALLPEGKMNRALQEFVYKNLSSSLTEFVDQVLEDTQGSLCGAQGPTSVDEIHSVVEKTTHQVRQEERMREDRLSKQHKSQEKSSSTLDFERKTTGRAHQDDDRLSLNDGFSDEDVPVTQSKKRHRMSTLAKSVTKQSKTTTRARDFMGTSEEENEARRVYRPSKTLAPTRMSKSLAKRVSSSSISQVIALDDSQDSSDSQEPHERRMKMKLKKTQPSFFQPSPTLRQDDDIENEDMYFSSQDEDIDDLDKTQLTGMTQPRVLSKRKLPLSMASSQRSRSRRLRNDEEDEEEMGDSEIMTSNWGTARRR